MSAEAFGCPDGDWGVLEASSVWRPEVLLAGLRGTGQPPTTGLCGSNVSGADLNSAGLKRNGIKKAPGSKQFQPPSMHSLLRLDQPLTGCRRGGLLWEFGC